jgi:hypothetical protein
MSTARSILPFLSVVLLRDEALFDEEDHCDLLLKLSSLCEEYCRMLKIRDMNQATQRVPADQIMTWVFTKSRDYDVESVEQAPLAVPSCSFIYQERSDNIAAKKR